MNRPMRRKDRQISEEEARALFGKGEYLFMATVGEDGKPYVVPLSYVILNNFVYFHCAAEGRKLDNLAFCPSVCLSVVGQTRPVYASNFTTYFESAIIEGEARKVADDAEKRRALLALAEKYLPEHMDKAEPDIARSWQRTDVYAVSVGSITGKAKRPKKTESD